MDKALIVAGVLLLTGCAHSPIPIGMPCTIGPIYLDKGAATRLSRDEKKQIILVNETGEKLCGWKP